MNGETEHSEAGGEAPQATADALPAATNGEPFFQRPDALSFSLTTALALAVYCVTLAPEVTLEFSGIFSVGAMYAGVPHPPGYPLWTIYAWLFTCLVPYSNIAWRVALSSAVAGALTCGVIALMASRGAGSILEGFAGLERLRPKAEQALRVVCGCVAGLAFGLDSAFWCKAVVVEVWPLTMLLFATVLCLLMRWMHRPERKRCLYLAALVYGLTLTNSQALAVAGPGLMFIILLGQPALGRDLFCAATLLLGTVLLAHALSLLPEYATQHSPMWRVDLIAEIILLLLCLGLAIKTRGVFKEWKGVLASGSMLALGLSFYLFVPLASHTNPPLNWGYPRTWEGFVHTLTRGQYESVRPTDSLSRYAEQLGRYGESTLTSFGVIYLLPVLVSFWFLRRMRAQERRWMLGLLGVFLCLSLLMVALLNPSADRASMQLVDRFFSASHLVLALWAGYGLALLGTIVGKARAATDNSCRTAMN
jgi:hypothetical protein